MKTTIPGFYPIHDVGVSCHLLVEGNQCVLIDTGLTPVVRFVLKRRMRLLGLPPGALKAIFLTHGHLDHTCNLDWIQRWSGAPVYVHREDDLHVAGKFPYRGANRICGWLEALGRAVFRYRAPALLHFFEDGEMLPFQCGLRVVQLPGHTHGHCGFFSGKKNLLFSGDLFACYLLITHTPMAFLNSCQEKMASSFRTVAEMNPRYIVCNHYQFFDPAQIRRNFQKLYEKSFVPQPI